MEKPFVSIIITTYNPVEAYLQKTIECIIKQTYTNWELIVFDDGSENVIKPVIESFHDDRIIYKRCDVNRGISACNNDALETAKGSIIAKMDDDDIAYPQWLEHMLSYFEANPNTNVLGCDCKLSGDKSGYLCKRLPNSRKKQQARLLLENAAISHGWSMLKKEFLDKYQIRYDVRYKSAIDYALWVEILKYSKLNVLPEILGEYRWHPKQISTKTYSRQQNFADEVRWNQLREIGIEPTEEQKKLHNKLGRIQPLEATDLKQMDEWLLMIKQKNATVLYFGTKELKQVLHQRAATLYLRYFQRTHDIVGLRYFIKYATVQNVKNALKKIR